MNFPPRYAILLDGGFVIQKLSEKHRKFPEAGDVVDLCRDISSDSNLKNYELLRIYFYHSRPSNIKLSNPVDSTTLDLGKSDLFHNTNKLLRELETAQDFALRLGEISINRSWKIKSRNLPDIIEKSRTLEASDLKPDIEQKGVDLRIGLDIARLALKEFVRVVVVVTGDSDLIPAFKCPELEKPLQ
jgi:uncharacterized LabA/DUF88 family protein